MNGDVARADELDHLRITVGDVLHDVAPVAPHRREIEEHEAVFLLGALKEFVGPRMPLYGVLRLGSEEVQPDAGEQDR